MLESLCLIPVDYYFFYYYYYSKVAISTFPHICLGTELEREVEQQRKSYNLRGKKRKRASLAPSLRYARRCSVILLLAPFSCSEVPNNCKTAAGRSCLASTEMTISEIRGLVSSSRAPHPRLGKVQANLCMLRMRRDTAHFPVALHWICSFYSTNRAVFQQIG